MRRFLGISGVIAVTMIGAAAFWMSGCGRHEETDQPGQAVKVAPDRPVVVFGRVPSGNPLDMLEKMEPMIGYLQDELNITVKPEFARDYAEFTRKMAENEYYDVAFCAPFQYVAAHEKAGYEAVLRPVRLNSDVYVGVILTADPSITSIKQLKGRKIAFVDQNSTSGFLFPLGVLAQNGLTLKDFEYQFMGGHDNVVLNVLSGGFHAGATHSDAAAQYAKSRASELVVLDRTDSIYNEPIAMSSKFRREQPELAAKIIEAIKRLHEADPKALATYDRNINRFVDARDDEYDTVRKYRDHLPKEVVEGTGIKSGGK